MASFRLKSAIATAVFLKKENKSMASIAQWRHFVCIISCALSPFRVHCCFFVSTRFFLKGRFLRFFFFAVRDRPAVQSAPFRVHARGLPALLWLQGFFYFLFKKNILTCSQRVLKSPLFLGLCIVKKIKGKKKFDLQPKGSQKCHTKSCKSVRRDRHTYFFIFIFIFIFILLYSQKCPKKSFGTLYV